MIDINKFLQLDNPDIARQTRNMSYADAFKTENPFSKNYQGYNPSYNEIKEILLYTGIHRIELKYPFLKRYGGINPSTISECQHK